MASWSRFSGGFLESSTNFWNSKSRASGILGLSFSLGFAFLFCGFFFGLFSFSIFSPLLVVREGCLSTAFSLTSCGLGANLH
jgi:hypothetical protein